MTALTLAKKLAGKFIVFDGPDGSGKSTQVQRLFEHLVGAGVNAVQTRDPGGSEIGDRIRQVLLGHDLKAMDVRCETFLFMASRAQLVSEVIDPALADGAVVLCDRFISSTYAYQGAAGYDVGRLLDLGNTAVGETWPDVTIVFDVPVDRAFARIGDKLDAMESRPRDFHEKVRDLFLRMSSMYPAPVHVVDGSGTVDDVHGRVLELLGRVDL